MAAKKENQKAVEEVKEAEVVEETVNPEDLDGQTLDEEAVENESDEAADSEDEEDPEELEEEQLTEKSKEEQLLENYLRREVNVMSRKERIKEGTYESLRQLHGVNKEQAELFMSESESFRKETDELVEAASVKTAGGRIMDGYVDGWEITDNGIPLLLVSRTGRKNYVIKIPYSHFTPFKPTKDLSTPEGRRALEYDLNSRIGSLIEFVVFKVIEKDRVAYASRLRAMEIRSRIAFKKRNGKAKINEGDVTIGRIVSVKNSCVVFEIGGAEVMMKSEELSWDALEDLSTEFTNTDLKKVYVESIEPYDYKVENMVYHLYRVVASKRKAEENPADIYYDQFKIDQRYRGVVKAKFKHGYFVKLADKMTVVCPFPAVGSVHRGDSCTVQITSKDDKTKHIYGKFIS